MKINRYRLKKGCLPPEDDLINGRRFVPLHEYGGITLSIETDSRKPSDFEDPDFDVKYFIVMDEEFGQPYTPFYDVLENDEDLVMPWTVTEVVSEYNMAMDQIDWLERV